MSGMKEYSWIPWLQHKSRSSTARVAVVACLVALFRFLFSPLQPWPRLQSIILGGRSGRPWLQWWNGVKGACPPLWGLSLSVVWTAWSGHPNWSLCKVIPCVGTQPWAQEGHLEPVRWHTLSLEDRCWFFLVLALDFSVVDGTPGYCTLLLTPDVNYMCVQMCLF